MKYLRAKLLMTVAVVLPLLVAACGQGSVATKPTTSPATSAPGAVATSRPTKAAAHAATTPTQKTSSGGGYGYGTGGTSQATPTKAPALKKSKPTKGRKGQGQQIVVTETDFKITMPKTLRAGTVTFEVENKGKVVHNLEIEGNGIDKKLSSNLDPGQKGTLTVNLKPGKYHVWCPVDGHADLGMNLHITVK